MFCFFGSELGAESDFELIDDDDMPQYPGETCPGKYLSTKPPGESKHEMSTGLSSIRKRTPRKIKKKQKTNG